MIDRDATIRNNIPLVHHLAKAYPYHMSHRADIVQSGMLGLIRAVDSFDATLGFAFSTYACPLIRFAMDECFHKTRTRILSAPASRDAIKVRKALEKLKEQDEAAVLAVAKELAMSRDKVVALMQSFETTTVDNYDCCCEEEEPDPAILSGHLRKYLEKLGPKHKQVICLRTGFDVKEPKTLAEIAELLSVSRERVRQIETEAVAKLQELKMNYLRQFLTL